MLTYVVTPRPPLRALVRLEPYAVKVARTVLRGGGGSNVVSLPNFGRLPRESDIKTRLATKGDFQKLPAGWLTKNIR